MRRNSGSNNSFSSYQLFALLTNIFTVIGLVVVFAVFEKFLDPFNRGFFCDDKSIQKPYVKSQAVPTSWAVVFCLVGVILVVVVCDCVNQLKTPCEEEHCVTAKKMKMKQWVYIMIVRVLTGLLGLGFTLILVGMAKVMIGRLRPHFLDVCKPSNCTGFVTFDACTTTNLKALREARKSFPSGHSAGAMFSTVFFALYLEYAMRPKHVLLLKPLLQFTMVFGGVAICLTRISDYFHHWSDVLAGIIIGTLFAFYTIYKLMDLPNQTKYLEEQNQLGSRKIEDQSLVTPLHTENVKSYNGTSNTE